MTARDYLESQLKDEQAEATSIQTRRGLAAYAIRMHKGVLGYSITDAKSVMRSCGCGDEFIQKCVDYILEANDFLNMASSIKVHFED